jgi:hypothetical protein
MAASDHVVTPCEKADLPLAGMLRSREKAATINTLITGSQSVMRRISIITIDERDTTEWVPIVLTTESVTFPGR